jgi:hypothetical protein
MDLLTNNDSEQTFRWRSIPAGAFAFVGAFLLSTSMGPWLQASFTPKAFSDKHVSAEQLATITTMLSLINMTGCAWLVAGWFWYKGQWWLAITSSMLGLALLLAALPDR